MAESYADRVSLWGMVLGVAFWVLSVLGLLLIFGNLPPEVPLFYSLPQGEAQLVSKGWFLGTLVIVGVVMGANFGLAQVLGKGELLLKRFLVWGGVVVLLLFLMSLVRVLLIIL